MKKRTKPEKPETVLVLRTCNADMTSYGGFQWPVSGPAEAKDWKPTTECGNGLHGFLWGEGDGSLANWGADAKWLVVEVPLAGIVDLSGKIKFRAGSVVFCGDRIAATGFLLARLKSHKKVIGATVVAGYGGTSTSGHGGTSTSGDGGTLSILWYDQVKAKWRRACAEVGKDGIKSGTPYKLTEDGRFIEADKKA